MNKENKQNIYENEISACTNLIEKTWDMGIYRDKHGTVVSFREVVSSIFDLAKVSASILIERFTASDELHYKLAERREYLESSIGSNVPSLYYNDGLYSAILDAESSLANMHLSTYISFENRLKPIFNQALKEHTGFDKTYPHDYQKYIRLHEADEDVAFDFSQSRNKEHCTDYKGITAGLSSDSILEHNTLYETVRMSDRGLSLGNILICNIFKQAMLITQYCNIREICAEIKAIDAKIPFTNSLVTLESPWAKLARSHNPKQQQPPFPTNKEQHEMLSNFENKAMNTAPVKSDKDIAENDKKTKLKASELIASIFNCRNP